MKILKNYINGSLVSKTEEYLPVHDPSTGEKISSVVLSNNDDLNLALESSEKAFLNWCQITPLKRSRIISKYKELIEKNIENLAKLVSEEHGKTLEDAKGSVIRGLEVVEFATGIPHLLKGEFSQNVGTDIGFMVNKTTNWSYCRNYTFQFSSNGSNVDVPNFIACGNSFILKPSEKDPSCSLKLAELFSEAGLPDGVFNVINGDKEIVNRLIESEKISSISFVGSTQLQNLFMKSLQNMEKEFRHLAEQKTI